MTTETTVTVTAEVRAVLIEAGAECRAADAADQAAQEALSLARTHREACQGEIERRAAERASWIARSAKKAETEIVAGRMPHAAPAADAKSQLEHASALANFEAAQQVITRRETAAAEVRTRREAAYARLQSLMTAADNRHVDELLERIAALRGQIDELRALAGAPLYAREMNGLHEFTGIVSTRQVDTLNRPAEPPLDIAALFAGRRFIVGFDTPLSAAREPLEEALAYWRARHAQLEAIAETGEVQPADVAA